MERIFSGFGKLTLGKPVFAAIALCAITAIAMPAQTLTTLHNFAGSDGQGPWALIQATNGDYYGTTFGAGAGGGGTVFKMTPNGTLTTLYNFCSQSGCTDGNVPAAALPSGTLFSNGPFRVLP